MSCAFHIPHQGVVVVWEWEWVEDANSVITHVSESDASIDYVSETSLVATSETNCTTNDQDHQQRTSTVTFKCIGTQHDSHAQSILKIVSDQLYEGQEVPVNIYPEPSNHFDAKAITFKC